MKQPKVYHSQELKRILTSGRMEEALSKLQQSAELKQWLPVSFEARQLLGRLRAASQSSQQATLHNRLLEKATELLQQYQRWETDPQQQMEAFSEAHRQVIDLFLAGLQQRRAGEHAKALRTFSEIIEREPTFTEAYIERATILLKQHRPDWESALRDFNQALAISPGHPLALTNRGYVYVHYLKDKFQACQDWQRVKAMGLPLADSLLERYCQNHKT